MAVRRTLHPAISVMFSLILILCISGSLLAVRQFKTLDPGLKDDLRFQHNGSLLTNEITNGNFETADFAGWTTVNHPEICPVEVMWYSLLPYEGQEYAFNDHYYDFFYQELFVPISNNTRFSGAMIAAVYVSDYNWHETRLSIIKLNLPTLCLHYRLQNNTPPDSPTDKYFLVGKEVDQWYSWDRNLYDDLIAKGATQYFDGTVTQVWCQQGGHSLTGYDALAITATVPVSNGGGSNPTSITLVPILVVGALGSGVFVFIVIALVARSGRRTVSPSELTRPGNTAGAVKEGVTPRDHPTSVPSQGTCPHCGATLEIFDVRYCMYCGTRLTSPRKPVGKSSKSRRRRVEIQTCMVCGLEIDNLGDVAKCPYCGSAGHRNHILEWLHVKGYCPMCRQRLNEKDLNREFS